MVDDITFLAISVIIGFVLNKCTQSIIDNIQSGATISISTQSFIFITTIIVFISFTVFGLSIALIKAIIFDSILIIVSFIDLKFKIIPNKLILLTITIGTILSFFDELSLMSNFAGMIFGGGIMFLLALVPKTLGGGDIKYMFALGIFLGMKDVILAIFLSFIIGGVASLIILLLKLKDKKGYIAFGPFLSAGSFIVYHFIS